MAVSSRRRPRRCWRPIVGKTLRTSSASPGGSTSRPRRSTKQPSGLIEITLARSRALRTASPLAASLPEEVRTARFLFVRAAPGGPLPPTRCVVVHTAATGDVDYEGRDAQLARPLLEHGIASAISRRPAAIVGCSVRVKRPIQIARARLRHGLRTQPLLLR